MDFFTVNSQMHSYWITQKKLFLCLHLNQTSHLITFTNPSYCLAFINKMYYWVWESFYQQCSFLLSGRWCATDQRSRSPQKFSFQQKFSTRSTVITLWGFSNWLGEDIPRGFLLPQREKREKEAVRENLWLRAGGRVAVAAAAVVVTLFIQGVPFSYEAGIQRGPVSIKLITCYILTIYKIT